MNKVEPEIINLPKFLDARGNLSFVEQENHIPFAIKRTYWVYDVPGGEQRWGRAFKESREFIVSLSGSFDVILDDGHGRAVFPLNRSYYGLYVPSGFWRILDNFSTNAVALVMSSTEFNEADYIRDYDEFKRLKDEGKI